MTVNFKMAAFETVGSGSRAFWETLDLEVRNSEPLYLEVLQLR